MKPASTSRLNRFARLFCTGFLALTIAACAPVTGLSPGWQITNAETLDIRQVWQADSVTWIRFGYHVPGAIRITDKDGHALTWARSGRVVGIRNTPDALIVSLGRTRAQVSYRGTGEQALNYGQLSAHDRETVLARLQTLPETRPATQTVAGHAHRTNTGPDGGHINDSLAWSANWRAHAGPAGLSSRMSDSGQDAVIAFVGDAMLPNDAGPVIDRMAELARAQSGVLMIRADVDAGAGPVQRVLAGKRARIVAGLLERSGVDSRRLVVAAVRDRFEPVRQAGLDSSIHRDTHPVRISFKPISAAGLGFTQRRDNG